MASPSEGFDDHEHDLPLSANINCITVHHFIVDLTCNLEDKIFSGCIIIFCKPNELETENKSEKNVYKKEICEVEGHQLKGGTISSPSSYPQLPNFCDNIDKKGDNNVKEELQKAYSTSFPVHFSLQEYDFKDFVKNTPSRSDLFDLEQTQISKAHKKEEFAENEYISCRDSSLDESEKEPDDFVLILDSSNIDVLLVEEIKPNSSHEDLIPADAPLPFLKEHRNLNKYFENLNAIFEQLSFSVDTHCIRIWKKGLKTPNHFPRVVRINYSTKPDGQSLKWTLDQDGSLCVFTHGHWLNNRSLFPSQDAPVSMATWEAIIHVSNKLTVLMSGDDEPEVTVEGSSDKTSFYYHTNMLMPTSTLALAVGSWSRTDMAGDYGKGILPCRLFSPKALEQLALSKIAPYLPRCLSAAATLLGPHPFTRLDVVIVPRCFDSLGMASPSLVFLSQSVLTGDRSLCIRLSHEVSHSWFGLAIGPKDWTEEWLTEGFCTYTEGYIHANVMGWDEKKCGEHADLRDVLRHRTLMSELKNTEEELQILRPGSVEPSSTQGDVRYIKNGMNPNKKFTQVHYLKGYFLLRHLEKTVGVSEFQRFLKEYVRKFHGQLVTSQDFFCCFLSMFPKLRDQGLSEEKLNIDWLEQPGVPKEIENFKVSEHNELAAQVYQQLSHCRSKFVKKKKKKPRKKQKQEISELQQLEPDQLLVFLDLLLDEEEDRVPTELLTSLRGRHDLLSCNAEVQHRWCELIVKHKVCQCYEDVEQFLINHQALGVYLYGEMIISESRKQTELAKKCFHTIKEDMEEGLYKTVHTMLYGS